MAVSALTFEAIASEAEASSSLDALARGKWRTNIVRFREQLLKHGGEVPAIGPEAIAHWGRLQLVRLNHGTDGQGNPMDMVVEERLVVATALSLGLIYVTHARDYNAILEERFGLGIEVV